MANNFQQTLSKIKVKLVAGFPFFANLLFHLPIEEDRTVDTLATDGRRIIFNPAFVNSLQPSELAFILLHETLHVALGHIWRIEGRDHMVWNISTDYVINNIIETECVGKSSTCPISIPMKNGKKIGLFEPKYSGWSAEKVYKDLMDRIAKSVSQSNGGGNSSSSGANASGSADGNGDSESIVKTIANQLTTMKELADQMVASHDKWNKMSKVEKQVAEREWTGRVAAAATQARMAGNMPASLEEPLGKLLKPQKDWKQLLREFIEVENFDFSWNPPDRRFSDSDFFMPDFNEKIEKVKDLYFFIDASGSMSNGDISKCASEIQSAIYQFKNHLHGKLAYFDTEVYKLYDIDDIHGDITKTRPTGRGGTDFNACFKCIENHNDVAGIIILSDGECSFPDVSATKGIPVLWIFTTPDTKAPYGKYTTLD